MKLLIEFLRDRIQREFPNARILATGPRNADGSHWLDVWHEDMHVVVEWRADLGFAFSSFVDADPISGAEGMDEVLPTLDEAAIRITHLLKTEERTTPRPRSGATP